MKKLLLACLAIAMLLPISVSAQEDENMSEDASMMESAVSIENYYLHTTVTTDFATTVELVRAALKDEGFGILTEIDFSATMKTKLDKDTPPCLILGACNPGFAWQVFQHEPWIGIELPCNVVVRQLEDGSVEVSMKNPAMLLELTENENLVPIGEELMPKVMRIMEAVSKF
jgi:uncharacterized protein (DUF302 family)